MFFPVSEILKPDEPENAGMDENAVNGGMTRTFQDRFPLSTERRREIGVRGFCQPPAWFAGNYAVAPSRALCFDRDPLPGSADDIFQTCPVENQPSHQTAI
jgi:hypothetical protein